MGCTTGDLREKDVVNICNGQRLGCVCELELDTDCGRITALIVSGDSFVASVLGKGRVRVPWDNIKRIGRDTILVEFSESAHDGHAICRDAGPFRRFCRTK